MSSTTREGIVRLDEQLVPGVELDTADGMLYRKGQLVDPSGVRRVRDLVEAGVLRLASLKSWDELDRPLYRLYQNFPHPPKNPAAPDSDWRINVTVLLAGTVVNGRYVLTVGHQNATNQIEIHQVIFGTALFCQQFDEEDGRVRGCYTIAGPGEVVPIVPGAWHLTVNIEDDPMAMVDVVRFRGDKPALNYKWRCPGGAAWFFTRRQGLHIEPNRAYPKRSVGRLQKPCPLRCPAELPPPRWIACVYASAPHLLANWTRQDSLAP